MSESQIVWENLTPEEKRKQLFLKQKKTLDLFLERNAISKAQYDKSLGDLIEKMGMKETLYTPEVANVTANEYAVLTSPCKPIPSAPIAEEIYAPRNSPAVLIASPTKVMSIPL